MKYLILFFLSLPLFAFQDCKVTIYIDPINQNINANEITLGAGNDVSVNNFTFNLNLQPNITVNNVWKCTFKKKINKKNLIINYNLVSSNGQLNGISNGSSFIPTTVNTNGLNFSKNNKKVSGDVDFIFDLSQNQTKISGNYTGVLTIEVYQN